MNLNKIILEDIENICKCDIFNCSEKTFLITGANGFLASYIVHTLLYLNDNKFIKPCKVIALVRNKHKAEKIFLDYLNRKDFTLLVQNVNDIINISENVNYIIHAASQASPRYYNVDPIGTLKANIFGTYNLLELAKNKNIDSFLFFSSGEVYGNTSVIPTNEKGYGYLDPLKLRSCYSESKRMGENICISYFNQYNIPVKIVRPFHTYGPRIDLNDGRVFADFIRNIIYGEDIVLKSDGKSIRTFCYISDAILGFFYVLFKGKDGEAYNISNGKCSISIKNLAQLLINISRKQFLKVKFTEDLNYLESSILVNCPDITKVNNLGWEAKIDLITGFERTINSFTFDGLNREGGGIF